MIVYWNQNAGAVKSSILLWPEKRCVSDAPYFYIYVTGPLWILSLFRPVSKIGIDHRRQSDRQDQAHDQQKSRLR